jgi:hypothetical protein
MTALGYMPLLRPGATLFSAMVVHRRMYEALSNESSFEAICGKKKAGLILGTGAAEVARRLFGSGTSARQVLDQHTLFGIYSRVMNTHLADQLANQIISGDGSRFRHAFRGHRQRRIPRLATPFQRSCQRCIEEDMERQGFSSWKVLHQLPSVGHCPMHGILLHQEESERNCAIRNWCSALPGETQPQDPLPKWVTFPMSDGYASYLKLWVEVFEGNLTGIAPDIWMLVMDAVVDNLGSLSEASEQIHRAIERSWGAPVSAIASFLDIADGEAFVRAELEQRVQASYVASRLVIVAALDDLNLSPPRRQQPPWRFPVELSSIRPFGSWLTPQSQEELRRCVMEAGFPPALFRKLADDLDVYAIDREIGVDRLMIRKFATRIPDDLLHRLSMEQTWSSSSWLMKELRRREIAWSHGAP